MAREIVARHVYEDEDGNEYIVFEYVDASTFRPIAGQSRRLAGARSFVLEDGRTLYDVPGDRFEIDDTGIILHKVETEAKR